MGRKRLAKNRGLPPNLYQNTAGYFYYVDPDRGAGQGTKGLGRDKAKAMQWARQANALIAVRAPTPVADWVSGKKDYSLVDWIPIYKELWVAQKKPAESTLRNVSSYLEMLKVVDFAWRKLSDINTAHIAEYLKVTSTGRGASTALHLRARLGDIFRMAETQGLIDMGRSPVTATYVPERAVTRERLSLDQFNAIRAHAPIWLQRGMDLALLTGQRREDIGNMKFADVKDGFLHIVQGKSQGAVRLRQDLNIRLDKVGMSIGDAITNCRDMIVSRYIVHHVANTGPSKPGRQLALNALTQGFQVARDKAGIVAAEGRTPPSFHEIRSLSERLYKEQYGRDFAQSILGHKNSKTTAKYDDLRGQGWQDIVSK